MTAAALLPAQRRPGNQQRDGQQVETSPVVGAGSWRELEASKVRGVGLVETPNGIDQSVTRAKQTGGAPHQVPDGRGIERQRFLRGGSRRGLLRARAVLSKSEDTPGPTRTGPCEPVRPSLYAIRLHR